MARYLLFALAYAFLIKTVHADTQIIIQGENTNITTKDIIEEVQHLPEEVQKMNLSSPDKVRQIANNIYLRRVFAYKARTEGLGNNPNIRIAINQSEENILAGAYIALFDQKNKISEDDLEKQALDQYKRNIKRFETPDQIRASHILIKKDDKNGRTKAEKILSELKSGAKFEDLAKQKSDDAGSAAKGGDLGFFSKGQMVPEFEKAAFSLVKIHELSKITETQFGWHIIRLEDRRKAGQSSFDEVKVRLKAEIANKAISNIRVNESQKMLEQVKANRDAIEAFSATYR